MAAELPPNMQEFNKIVGLVFSKLYPAHPVPTDIEADEIATLYGVEKSQFLPSGRTFNDVFAHTMAWLLTEGYTDSRGASPRQRVVLATKGLQAMNAVPSGLTNTVGEEIVQKTTAGKVDVSWIGELIGSTIGGWAKTMSS